jgi:hypothetical protein
MSIDLNKRDIELLNNNHQQLILELQELIDIIIYQFIGLGKFKYAERNEVKQYINFELLNKISKIQSQFHQKSLLRTYLGAIIRNICNEIIRNKQKSNFILFDKIEVVDETIEKSKNSLIFEEEMIRLRKIIGAYYKNKDKLILCLKIKYKMFIEIEDFRKFNKNITQEEFETFLKDIQSYDNCPESKIFQALTFILNKYENKGSTPDSIRKWVTDKIIEIIDLLNGSPPSSKYDKETVQILFEKCYNKAHSINSTRKLKV